MRRMLEQVAACLVYARRWRGWSHQDRNEINNIESSVRRLADRFDRREKEHNAT